MPADPFARSVFTRSEVFSLRACKRHANAHTLGGTLGWDPGPQEKGPGPRDPGEPRGGRGAPRAQKKLEAKSSGWCACAIARLWNLFFFRFVNQRTPFHVHDSFIPHFQLPQLAIRFPQLDFALELDLIAATGQIQKFLLWSWI